MKPLIRISCLAAAALLIAACQPTTPNTRTTVTTWIPPASVPAGLSPVEATWAAARVVIPRKFVDGRDTLVMGTMSTGRVQRALAALTEQGTALPVIIFLHGCDGGGGTTMSTLAFHQVDHGYVTISPDSFARPNRQSYCGQSNHPQSRTMRWRHEEATYALAQLQAAPWARKSHIYLAGQSEGGLAISSDRTRGYRGRMLFGTTCFGATHRRVSTPNGEPTLVIVGSRDHKLRAAGANPNHTCRVNSHPASGSLKLPTSEHVVAKLPAAQQAINRFLRATE